LRHILSLRCPARAAAAGRGVRAPAPTDHWQFAGAAIAHALTSLPRPAVTAVFHLSWWLHGATLLGFLVLLPYSKHLHILVSPLNVFFAPLTPKGQFRNVDLENSETFGVGNLSELAWKDLFDTYNCTECVPCTS